MDAWPQLETPAAEDPGFPWLLTACDLMTQCLMFMVLISVFGTDILRFSPKPAPRANRKLEEKVVTLEDTQRRLEAVVAELGMRDLVKLKREKGQLTILLADAIFFESGSADLRQAGSQTLRPLGKALVSTQCELRVEGYTDNVPIRSPRFASNWELSAARAIAVLGELRAAGVEARRLAAAGYGEYLPRFPNDSETNRAANRRVEIACDFD